MNAVPYYLQSNTPQDAGMPYPGDQLNDPMLPPYPDFGDGETTNPIDTLLEYQRKWVKENEQELDDWEYFYYGIPAGNETFLDLGD